MSGAGRSLLPVLTVIAGMVVLWYALAVLLNAAWAYDQAGRDGVTLGPRALVAATMSQERPRLPAPHQVVAELWRTTIRCRRAPSAAWSTTAG